MKLAVNFSDSLLKLLRQDPGLPVDYIKVPTIPFPECFGQFEEGSRWRSLLPHPAQPGVLALGHSDPKQRFNPELLHEIIARTQPTYLSTHMEVKVDYFPEFRDYQHSHHPELRRVVRERLLRDIAEVKQATGLPLVLENFPYYLWLTHFRLGAEPEFIAEVCAAGECGFLLDIAHARCSAASLGVSDQAYLAALPLARLREIHLAGVEKLDYGVRDTHTALDEWDYQLFQEVLGWARPELITLEYGGMPEQISGRYGEVVPIARNNPFELETMIYRIRNLMDRLNG